MTGFNKDTITVEKLQTAFPTGIQVTLPKTKTSNKSKGFVNHFQLIIKIIIINQIFNKIL